MRIADMMISFPGIVLAIAVAGIMGAKAFSMGYSSVLGVVIFEETMAAIITAVVVAFVVSFIATYILFKDEPEQ